MSDPFALRDKLDPSWRTRSGFKPPTLVGGKFQTQADLDSFNALIKSPYQRGAATVEGRGGTANLTPEQQNQNNARELAYDFAYNNGIMERPKHQGVGITGSDFMGDILPILAMLAAPALGLAGVGAGAGAAATTAETSGLTADQLLAQSAAGLSPVGLADTAAGLGVGEVSALAPAATAIPSDGGGNTAFGGGNQSAAVVGGGSPSTGGAGSTLLQAVKDYGGTALLLGGLLGGGASAPDMPNAPPPPDAPPDSQEARQPDELTRRKQAAGGSTDNTLLTGASGIDPFTLNLGRSKLLGQ